jgi:aminopeptidase N
MLHPTAAPAAPPRRAAALAVLLLALGPLPLVAQSFPEPPPVAAARAPEDPFSYAPGVDVLHYDLEIGLGEGEQTFEGRARIRVLATAAAPNLPLDLTGLAVEDVDVGPLEEVAGVSYTAGVLRLPLADARPGDTVTVDVAWSGTPDDALQLGRNLHGEPAAFADNWPNRARFWFPSVDHPSDKATVRYTIHAPAAWDVVANGHLAAPPHPTPAGAPGPGDGPRRTWVWATDVAIPTYTMVLGAAEMEVRVLGRAACGAAPASPEIDGCVEVSWWAFPPDTAHAARIFRRAVEMTDFYTELIGPFPYEKLAHVQSSTRFGGMENASAIFYSGQALASGTLSEGTVAHEIAHQWFGDAVTETSWSHLWLSEGFATYFASLFFEHADGVEVLRDRLEEERREIVASNVQNRPVVDRYPDLYDLLNDNSYEKGGWVLHMLRGLLGDETFFRGIRAYYDRHRHGTVLTRDFQAVMEEVSGRDLETFFQQWIFEPGYPILEVERRWVPAEDGGTLEVTVRQIQDEAWPRFEMPVEIEVRQGGRTVRETLELAGERSVVRMELPGNEAPDAVALDPEGWLLTGEVVYR